MARFNAILHFVLVLAWFLLRTRSAADVQTSASWAEGNKTMDAEHATMQELLRAWNPYAWPPADNITSEHCEWNGVKCDEDGSVIEIILRVMDIEGTIPPEIGDLAKLEKLYLNANFLSGIIPSEIGRLQSLTHLSLGENKLEGSIPPEVGNMTSLQYLYLYNNKLNGSLPTTISRLRMLRHLGLWQNLFSGGIPSTLGEVYSSTLMADNIPGTSQVDRCEQAPALEFIWLNNNMLNGTIPASLGMIASLEFLYLSGNYLEGTVPTELGALQKLQGLYISATNVSGTIPCEVVTLPNLKKLEAASTNVDWCGSFECQLEACKSEGGTKMEL